MNKRQIKKGFKNLEKKEKALVDRIEAFQKDTQDFINTMEARRAALDAKYGR